VTIDVHTHIFPSGWPDFAARYGGDRWPRLEGDPATGCRLFLGTTLNRSLTPHAFDPARRLEDMDRVGIDTEVLSLSTPNVYFVEGKAQADVARLANDAYAELAAKHRGRFLGFASIPMDDPDAALARVARAVGDWSGGTRIGACLGEFNRKWSRRLHGQGAMALLISDGLDREAAEDLARQMERLHKSCRRLIWLNPLLRYPEFEAKPAGIRAMLPHVDAFLPVHNLQSLEELSDQLSTISHQLSAISYQPRRHLASS